MASHAFLTDVPAHVVIDTSTAINLNGTGFALPIVEALPFKLLATVAMTAELEEGRRRGRSDADCVDALVDADLLEIVALDDAALHHFEALVIGPAASTLDDGEAATIACALSRGTVAVIDERKATRICSCRFPELRVAATIDLLAHQSVLEALGRSTLETAIFNALKQARMSVPLHHEEWVVNVIGPGRAALCASLSRRLRTEGAGRA